LREGEPLREAPMTSPRRFPTPWQVEPIPGGFKVVDALDRIDVRCEP
jgi:hypothetical protein